MDSNWLDSHKAFKKPPMSLRQAWNCFLRGLIRFPVYIGVIEESSTTCRYYNLKHSQLVSSIHLWPNIIGNPRSVMFIRWPLLFIVMFWAGKFERTKLLRNLKVLLLKKLQCCRPGMEVKLYINLGQIPSRFFYIMLACSSILVRQKH